VTLAEEERCRLESLVRAHSPPQPWPFGVRCSAGRRRRSARRIFRSPRRSTVTAIPLAGGAVALFKPASGACKMRRARVAPGAFPPSPGLEVLAMATRKPATYSCCATRWSLADLGDALWPRRTGTMRRSSLWRLLEAADLQPHRRVYGLNSQAPDLERQAHGMCALYLNALGCFAPGRVGMCSDAKTGRQILERASPTPPLAPGPPEKREPEYLRPGPRALLASFMVAPGQVVWHLGQTRTRADLAAPLAPVGQQLPDMPRYDWGVENLNTPWRLDVCRVVAQWCQGPWVATARRRGGQRRAFLSAPTPKHVFHLTPTHGAWLHQGEWWLSVFARRCLTRGDFCSAHDCATRLDAYRENYHTPQAPPYRWTYTGHPLVRATPFSQTRRQQRHGRAWFGARPSRFAPAFSPSRPYKRAAA
jgi:hypothetical protein